MWKARASWTTDTDLDTAPSGRSSPMKAGTVYWQLMEDSVFTAGSRAIWRNECHGVGRDVWAGEDTSGHR